MLTPASVRCIPNLLHTKPLVIDILAYSTTYELHVSYVCTMLVHLLQHQLIVKAEKCENVKDYISFLGYVISRQGVEMDISKVRMAFAVEYQRIAAGNVTSM